MNLVLEEANDVCVCVCVCVPHTQVAAAMNLVLEEANERLKVPLRGLGTWIAYNKVRGMHNAVLCNMHQLVHANDRSWHL